VFISLSPKITLCLALLLLSVTIKAEQIPVISGAFSIQEKQLNQPSAVAIYNDHIYLLDGTQHRLLKFNLDGSLVSANILNANNERPHLPMDVIVNDAGIFIADTGNQRLLKYDHQGHLQRIFKPAQVVDKKIKPVQEGNDELKPAVPVALTIIDYTLYWADRANHRICSFDIETWKDNDCFGGSGQIEGLFQNPFQMAADSDGYLHIVDVLNGRVQVFNKQGRFISQIARFGVDVGELYRPNGLAIDAQDTVFVNDNYLGFVALYKQGRYLGKLKNQQGELIQLKSPVGMTVYQQRLYVVEASSHQLQVLPFNYQSMSNTSEKAKKSSQSLSQKNCVICHLSWVEAPDKVMDKEHSLLPVATTEMCYSCHHGVILDSRLAILSGEQHPTLYDKGKDSYDLAYMNKRKDKMPDSLPLTEQKKMRCTTCHTPHNANNKQETLYQGHQNAWMRVSPVDGDLCERCHESKIKGARSLDMKKRGINHPLAIKLEKPPQKDSPGFALDSELHQGLPLHLQEAAASLDKSNRLICQSCHQVHGGHSNELLALDDDKADLCAQCHKPKYSKDIKQARQFGIHPVNVELEEPVTYQKEKITRVTCESCHKVHSGKQGTALLPTKDQEALCQSCHKRQHAKNHKDALKKGIHPMNEKLEDPIKFNKESIEIIGCLTCHSVHSGKKNTPSLVMDHKDGQLCEQCHENKRAVVGSDHDLRITAKDKHNLQEELPNQSGVCGGCHSLHKGEGKYPRLFAVKPVKGKASSEQEPIDEPLFKKDILCLNCHQDKGIAKDKVIAHFDHPYKDLILRSDPKVMPLLNAKEEIEEFGSIACVTCHEAHLWEPAPKEGQAQPSSNKKNLEGNSDNSFLRHASIEGTFCIDCHGLESRPKYKYYHDRFLVRDIGVDYIK